VQNGIKPSVGDVFQIPVSRDTVGYGQVLASIKPNPLYIGVFEPLFPSHAMPELKEILESPLLLLATSLDAKIWHGLWPIVGHTPPVLDNVPFPAFITSIGQRNEYFLTSYDGKRRRPATAAEVAHYDRRTTVAPMRLENALKAHHGLMPWEPHFDRLTADHVRDRAQSSVSW
jgi:hypothetical protein